MRKGMKKERRKRHERHIIPLRRAKNSPLNLQGEKHPLPTLPQGALPIFSGDGRVDPKRHLDLFLDMCDFHLIQHDDVMVRLFLQTLTGQAYEWYTSLPIRSISDFDDIEKSFFTMYAPPVAYHTLLTNFTQIHMIKGERIRDFNLIFFKTLNKIPEEKNPNDPVILGCYKNAMPSNVKFSIRDSLIEYLDHAIQKATEMEEIMLETGADPEFVLGKIQK
jgi:hypothetical protein